MRWLDDHDRLQINLEDDRDEDDQDHYDGLGGRQSRHPLWVSGSENIGPQKTTAPAQHSQPNTRFPIAEVYIILMPCRRTSDLL
jgi:hypothetical protein